MKLEKINENQIRCTLTAADLEERNIRLSELAYGSEKARNLFRDMMIEAHRQFGFVADNIPLMIEAVPMSSEGLVMVITKVEDPEELDTRFSRFTMPREAGRDEKELSGADDILDAIHRIYESKIKAAKQNMARESSRLKGADAIKTESENDEAVDLVRCYSFSDMDTVIEAAGGLGGFYHGENTLYKLRKSGKYQLVVHEGDHSAEEFNKVCNILSEYGKIVPFSKTKEAHMAEHEDVVIEGQALQELATLL
ncbi:MAG: adaptor protein MecA [Lachnospiraceae bacterium]|nr:adaptor protein MecA [Lachnospiraceae bacterium]